MSSYAGLVLPYPYPPIPTNVTDPDTYCTLALCPLTLAQVEYIPSLAGNALYAAIFGLVLLAQLGLGIRFKTWGFLVGMTLGLLCEVIGYAARIQTHNNPFRQDPFLMYLITLTIGPAFLSGSIYLCLARIVIAFSESTSRIRPRSLTLGFMACDFIALLLQAIGGAMASTANTESDQQVGINIMLAGVSWQVASLVLFSALCIDYGLRSKKSSSDTRNPAFRDICSSHKFKGFLIALAVATLAILIRSAFRCAELSQGFDGRLANQEVTFMILEGAMIIIAVISLTIFHPGVAFQGKWADAGWKLGSSKKSNGSSEIVMETIDRRSMRVTSVSEREGGDEESSYTTSHPTFVVKDHVAVGHAVV